MNNKKATLLVLLLALLLILLTGCSEDPQRAALRTHPEISDLGEFDGCQVKYVNRGYDTNSFFMARCPGTAVTMTQEAMVSQGKSQVLRRSVAITEEIAKLEKEKASAEAREKALQKLSPEERKALGL